ncbi:capsule assembly Wzi family protein [Massilibacteroides sp.]|uniref:capsule assembly Wzi family protein n=1 Tax=Massilibacteroides sp. TaxID=2034766 RepID=UPI00262EE43E|nr:capsule assembly Wzi family protein [Massilibacteroides sp.]MDD4515808.1 capsule assembly Wzi family protein [Massilibacteroides sp.]
MKMKFIFILCLLLSLFSQNIISQNDSEPSGETNYFLEAMGSAASGEQTPFWIVSNRNGVVPLESGNGLLRAGVFHQQTLKDGFRWTAGLDLVGVTPRYRNVYIQQLYVELGYKAILISLGSKERYNSIVDKRLSSGDMVFSPNARPIPEINFSIPEYTNLPYSKGWLQVKGDFAVGRSFDKNYLENYTSTSDNTITYVNDVLWHHKSGFLRIEDTENDAPLFGILGLEHWAQWGGTSTNPKIGKQPQSVKDFIRVITGSEGGKGATASDSINVLGNHFGSYYFGLGYKFRDFGVLQAYHQHFFEDLSGMELSNGIDGLWGVELKTNHISWLKKIVVEFLTTKNQSGPMHFISFDREKHPGRGGGADNYFNNGEYSTGASYFNRALGSPLIISPEYNGNGEIGFKNNRMESWHLGAEGSFSSQLSYRLLLTTMTGWGRASKPFLETKSSVATLAEVYYTHPKLEGWKFGGAVAFDTGDMIEKNAGFSLSIRKEGILKN